MAAMAAGSPPPSDLAARADEIDLLNRAIEDYNQSIRLNPNYGNAFLNRGHAFAEKSRYDLAIADYDQARFE